MVSQGEELALQLVVDGSAATQTYFKHDAPLFEAEYRFIHGPLCGPTLYRASEEGDFLFPYLEALGYAEPPKDIHCIWELQVHRGRDLWLHFDKVSVRLRSAASTTPCRQRATLRAGSQQATRPLGHGATG